MQGISKELQSKIPKLKPGEKVIFEILGIRYDAGLKKHIIRNSTGVPATDRIYDKWANGGEGDYVDISYVVSERPSGPNSTLATVKELGTIMFTRDQAGRIIVRGGNKREEALYEYLYLSNYNASNAGKEWFIRPNSGFIFQQVKQAETSKSFLKRKRMIRQAEEAIDIMADSKLREVAKGLSLNTDDFTDVDTIREILYKRANENPESVLKLDDDLMITYIALAKDAEKAGVIKKDISNSVWRWSDGDDIICVIVPGKSAEESIAQFFTLDKGQSVYNAINSQLNPSKKGKEVVNVKARPAKRS